MRLCKAHLKLLFSRWQVLLTYIIVFTAVAALMTQGSSATSYTDVKAKIWIINHDDSASAQAFVDYMKTIAEVSVAPDSQREQEDALFYTAADAILTIPQAYFAKLRKGTEETLLLKTPGKASGAVMATQQLQFWISSYAGYAKTNMSETEILAAQRQTYQIQIPVTLAKTTDTHLAKPVLYFNFITYTMLIALFNSLTLVMGTYRKPTIQRRLGVSPLPYWRFQLAAFAGNLVLTLVLWLAFVAVACGLFNTEVILGSGRMLLVSSGLMILSAQAFAGWIARVFDKRAVVEAMATMIPLGFSFLSGAFVPQSYLPDFVLKIAHLMPSYWAIRYNNLLAQGIQEPLSLWVLAGFTLLFIGLDQISVMLSRQHH